MYLKIESDRDIKSIHIIFSDGGVTSNTTSFTSTNEAGSNIDHDHTATDYDRDKIKAANLNNLLERLSGVQDTNTLSDSSKFQPPDFSDRAPLVDETFTNKSF